MNKIIILIILFGSCSLLSTTTWEINQDGTGDFVNIQAGIDAATDGDTVLVYPGTYYENINFLGKDITVASLILTTGDESYIYNTIIDGNEEWSVVEFDNNETEDTVLQGFTIQNGIGHVGYNYSGGGIFINHASPILKDLLITQSIARIGGGIFFSSSNSFLENVTITGNHAYANGGGISIGRIPNTNAVDCNLTFSTDNKCNIYNNTAGSSADIMITEAHNSIVNYIIVDTFTILNPTGNLVKPSFFLELSIDNQWLEPAEHDLYVHPEGDDSNSGATPDEPLHSIQWALTKISADSLNPRTIHLDKGIYSPGRGQLFPLNMRSHVTLKGVGKEKTIIEWDVGEDMMPISLIDSFYARDNALKDMTIRNFPGSYTLLFSSKAPYKQNALISGINIYNTEGSSSGISLTRGNITIKDSEFFNSINELRAIHITNRTNPDNSEAVIENITIMNHQPDYQSGFGGSALTVGGTDQVTISNCLFANNTLLDDLWPRGAVSLLNTDTLYFTNNTVVNNHQDPGSFVPTGAIRIGRGGDFYLTNNIIYDNSDYTFITLRGQTRSKVYLEHNLIEGGTDPAIIHVMGYEPYGVEFIWGEGNIDGPVHFYGQEAGLDPSDPLYYQLTEYSPAVDAGTPDTTGLHLPPWDLLYNRRVWDGLGNGEAIIDMGCYEYGAPSVPQSVVSADEPAIEIPQQLSVKNYPNPFNPDTTIEFELPQESDVTLEIFNIKGQKVRKLYDCYSAPGIYSLYWNGKDDNGRQLPSGIYLYKLVTEYEVVTRKMMLLK